MSHLGGARVKIQVPLRGARQRAVTVFRTRVLSSRKTLALFAAVIIIAGIALVGVSVSVLAGGPSNRVVGFDDTRVMEFEKALVGFGPRWSGTENEMRTAEYVSDQFTKAGLNDVKIEQFDEILWEVNTAEVSLVPYNPLGILPSVREQAIGFEHKKDFVVQGYSGSRASPNFRWDLLPFKATGDGSNESHFAGGSGRACIVEWKEASIAGNTVIFFNAWRAGCAALLAHNMIYAEELGFIPISKGTAPPATWPNSSYPDIPFAAMSKEMGDAVNAHSGWKLRIRFDVTIETRQLNVVTGDVKGTVDPTRFIMLGAHHDNVYVNNGAVDDGTGTATVIELAWQLAKMQPKYTIRLATFGGEEQGLLGSQDWRDAHFTEVNESMIAMLQFDMNHADLERCTEVSFYTNNNDTLPLLREAEAKVRASNAAYKKYQTTVAWGDTSRMGSDMAVFAAVGKTAMFAFGCGSFEYHTYLDDIDRIQTESMGYTGRVFGTYALSIASR